MDFRYEMAQLMQQMSANFARIQGLFQFLQGNPSDTFTLPGVVPSNTHCFRIVLRGRSFQLSVSCPPDVSYPCFETALMNAEGRLIYNEELGYDDICRFDTAEKVLEEILRLAH